MSQTFVLTSDHFVVEKGTRGLILCLSPKIQSEITFVLFSQDYCKPCEDLMIVFKKLAQIFPSVQFVVVNLSRNPSLVEDSQNTILPFETTPIMVLYWNRLPYLQYKGTDRSYESLANFLQEMLRRLPKKEFYKGKKMVGSMQEVASYNPQDPKSNNLDKTYPGGIPYSIVCDSDKGICYLTQGEMTKMQKQYQGNQNQQGSQNQQGGQKQMYQNRNIEGQRGW